jgi:predicted lipoprotein with Yx(FWY)xxD motif
MQASVGRTTCRLTIVAAAVAVLAIAVPVSVAAAPTTVSTAHNAKLGTILVSAQGHTLYAFTKGTACTGSCARTWKPLLGGAAVGKHGAKSSLISLSTISGGNKQVTYNHHALYTYAGDHSAGQANGEGISAFGGKWYAVNTSGNDVTGGGNCNPVCGHY